MRVTTNLIFDQNFRAINTSQGQLSDIQTQLASGRKLLRPSDDPVGAVQVIRLTEEIDKTVQYRRNIDLATNNLELQDTTMRSINEIVNRGRVLVVQAGNGIVSREDRRALASEIEQIRNQVVDLMNTQNASGEYIFAGFQSREQAFVFNPGNASNPIQFQGDDGINSMQLSDSVSIQTTVSGKTLFEDVKARLDIHNISNAGFTFNGFDMQSQDDFDVFHQQNYSAVNPANNQYQLELLAGNQVQVTNLGTGAVVGNVPYVAGQATVFEGLSFDIQGPVGSTLDFDLQPPDKQNLAETLHRMSLALNDPNISDYQYQQEIRNALVGLDNGLEKMARENSSVGARLNIAESVLGSLLDNDVANQKARSAIQDVDYAEASAEFSKQETALSAAFASFPRVAGLSLFDFI
ncbi:flagellar hook-associated protein FlgL [Agaribacter flavus]|uniref:Flagellar hook-associated protein FlgL n=1 Tax=Agaribacter flavus TaxID=1902781 RepID=A0ABV7FR12_9ALTE